jgi:hypothetical protein
MKAVVAVRRQTGHHCHRLRELAVMTEIFVMSKTLRGG